MKEKAMNIEEVLDKLGEFITCTCDRKAITQHELEEIEKVEDALHAYVCEKGDL